MPSIEEIRKLIGDIDLPVSQIEKMCNIPKSTLSQVLNGNRPMPERHYKSMLLLLEKVSYTVSPAPDMIKRLDELEKRVIALESLQKSGEISIRDVAEKESKEFKPTGSLFFQNRQKKATGG